MDDQMRVRLAGLLKKLSEREALVLQLYYIEEMNLDEISEVLSVTIGRVSQLKKSALAQLRSWLSQD
jgi:RNA polymerase sigma factor for flagellar operon FliA